MTPIARHITIAIAVLFALTASEAHAGYWHRDRYWVAPEGFCRLEPIRRGFGPTLETAIVYRCYSEDAPMRPHRTHGHVLRARG